MAAKVQSIALDRFDEVLGNAFTEISSASLGGKVLSCSDDFFAEASNLLKPSEPQILKGQYGPNGALFDGWESRRHNPTFDWTIIQLGATGTIAGFDVDTRWFNGNEAPAVTVHGLLRTEIPSPEPSPNDPDWVEILPMTPCGPAQRHLFLLPSLTAPYSHVKLSMYPDGGIGRFRVYGTVQPSISNVKGGAAFDLAHVHAGGRCVAVSDQHFGKGGNLILPGRGVDMGDGWETKRSRGGDHNDWAVIKLGQPGYLEWIELDTAHFIGNFPAGVEVHAILSDLDLPAQSDAWQLILPRAKLGPHRQHYFQLSKVGENFSHVRVTIHPDGGIKRVRVIGRPSSTSSPAEIAANPTPVPSGPPPPPKDSLSSAPATVALANGTSHLPTIPALPLTLEAFLPYGSVIQSFPDQRAAPARVNPKLVNFGTATKFSWLADVKYLTPEGEKSTLEGKTNFCVYRCDPEKFGGRENATWEVKVLERHEFSTQAFVPMGNGGERYLVIVVLPGADGQADLDTLRAFIATSTQGISYNPNVWHHPMIALDKTTDFACLVNETGDAKIDCEIKEYGQPVAVVVDAGATQA